VLLSGRPNNLAITNDGGRVLVGIRSKPGVVDVIETTSLKRVKSIPVDGGVHNVYITPTASTRSADLWKAKPPQ